MILFEGNGKRFSNTRKAFVPCPQAGLRSEPSGWQKMQIDKTNAFAHQLVGLKKYDRFLVAGLDRRGQVTPKADQLRPVVQVAAGQFTDNHWMGAYQSLRQQFSESIISAAQMIHPHRRIHQNHYSAGSGRGRGIGLSADSAPPSAARGRRVQP